MSRIVLDASVALAWCFPDEASPYADSVLVALEGHEIIVPPIWSVEVANALVVGERRKRIRQPDIVRFTRLLGGLPIFEDAQPAAETIDAILPLARVCDLSAYDAAYIALALRRSASLATLDAALREAAKETSIPIFKL